MRAIVLDRPGSLRVADLPDPTPRTGEVVVRVDHCGICRGGAMAGCARASG
jgi:NADPH:quinone reductase-like Zn-dependent oxidoreductase